MTSSPKGPTGGRQAPQDPISEHAWEAHLDVETVDAAPTVIRTDERAVGLTILAHPDPTRVGERALLSVANPAGARLSRTEPLFARLDGGPVRPLAVPYVSRKPILFECSSGDLRIDPSQTSTPLEIEGAPALEPLTFGFDRLQDGLVILQAKRICLLLHEVPTLPPHPQRPPSLIGSNERMLAIYDEIRRVADTGLPVLLRGESGTGKELVARAIHDASERRDGPWVAINVAAIAPSLAAAELFGAKAGAFTGAKRSRPGIFRQAAGGTLFLDEIGAADPEIQAMLLRVLEDKLVRSVGSETGDSIDVRVITATDLDLEAAVARGDFRETLLQRLGGYEIRLPPLRKRRDDLGRLLVHFLERGLGELSPDSGALRTLPRGWLPARLVGELARHPLPGNVRQLSNLASRIAVRFHDLDRVETAEVLAWLEASVPFLAEPFLASPATALTDFAESDAPALTLPPDRSSYRDPSEVDDDELEAALEACDWRIRAAAKALNVSRGSLYALIEKSDRVHKAADLYRREIEAALHEAGGDLRAAARQLRVSRHGLKQRMKELGLL